MRIKLLKTIDHANKLIAKGRVIEIDADEGKAFIAAEHAVETNEAVTTDEDAALDAAVIVEAAEAAAVAERKAAAAGENKADEPAADKAEKQPKNK